MGILGDIGTGILVGNGITDVVVKYSKQQYMDKIDRLSQCASELGQHLSNLKGFKEQLKQIWDDEDAEKYHRNLDKEIKSVENAQAKVNDQIQLWTDAIKEMTDTVGEERKKIDTISGILDSLNIQD